MNDQKETKSPTPLNLFEVGLVVALVLVAGFTIWQTFFPNLFDDPPPETEDCVYWTCDQGDPEP